MFKTGPYLCTRNYKMCETSCVQYVVLKKGPLAPMSVHVISKRALYFAHDIRKLYSLQAS